MIAGGRIRTILDKLTIRRKLVVAFASISLIPVVVLGSYLLFSQLSQSSLDTERSISDKLRIATLMWDAQKQGLLGLARTAAADNFIILNRDLGLDQALSGYLNGIKIRNSLSMVMALGVDGELIASSESTALDQRPSYAIEALNLDDFAVQGPRLRFIKARDEPETIPVMVAAQPIYSYANESLGYIAVGSSLDGPDAFFGEEKAQIGVPYFVISGSKVRYAADPAYIDAISAALLQHPGLTAGSLPMKLALKQARYITGSVMLEEGGGAEPLVLLVAYPAAAYEASLNRSMALIVAVILLSIVLALFAGLLLASNVIAPMAAIAEGARAIVAGDYSVRLPVRSADEIGRMAEEFNAMSLRLSRTMEALAQELEEKNVLLKEVHHRVKNNMQVISSLLHLQRSSLADPKLDEALEVAQARIHSMASVHEVLYTSNEFGSIELSELFDRMLRDGLSGSSGEWHIRGDPVRLSLERAIPCALAVNELAMNAVKYAEAGAEGYAISIGSKDGLIRIAVEDRGSGIEPIQDPSGAKGIGLMLVRDLAKQLHGRMDIHNRTGGGACALLEFPAEPGILAP